MQSVRIRTAAFTVAAALSLPLTLGISASQASASDASPTATGTASPSPSPSPSPGNQSFGPDCSMLPQSGNGSAAQMAHENVATAVENNPNLSMLADAIKKTDLASTLKGLKGSTVFAPTNDAFDKLGAAKRDALLNDKAQLAPVTPSRSTAAYRSPAATSPRRTPRCTSSTVFSSRRPPRRRRRRRPRPPRQVRGDGEAAPEHTGAASPVP
ncbi:fasciclin domain-containing protein [Streptomyces sp. NRRL F-5555]|uniref:fasciclin domain-containing protein n=1 Tax=Streptomyces sp. NRRL F-5555 TaxID=1463863 RepID=UPI000A756EEA|nr:fasciclin domain-containing protein [Streptomyces sp. NRRL F-5555]